MSFFKLLAKKQDPDRPVSDINRLKIWIPDTIVLNEKDCPPMWFYSSQKGFVYRTDSFSSKNVSSKLSNFASPDELVAIIKKV